MMPKMALIDAKIGGEIHPLFFCDFMLIAMQKKIPLYEVLEVFL